VEQNGQTDRQTDESYN